MPNKVVPIGGITKLDIPADRVLEAWIGKLESVVIMGWDKEEEEVFVSSLADGADALWLMERFKLRLLQDDD